jgi:hypothetical protein
MTTLFKYNLTGVGWADAIFSNGEKSIEIQVSYLSEPLIELVEGLLFLNTKVVESFKVSFRDEPGEHLMYLTKINDHQIKVEIFKNEEWEDSCPVNVYGIENKKLLVYYEIDDLANFSRIIYQELIRLLKNCGGVDGYLELWRYDFPEEDFSKLGIILAEKNAS